MIQAGRWIGFLTSGATLVLWAVFLFANPYDSEGISSNNYAPVAVMMALAAAGMLAAWRIIPILMFIVFGISLFPVGLYLLGTPGMFKWVGVCNLLFLPSGLLMRVRRRHNSP